MKDTCSVCKTAKLLVVIGALNWGIIGVGGFADKQLNVVHIILGAWPAIEWLAYVFIGLSGASLLMKNKKCCGGSCDSGGGDHGGGDHEGGM